MASEFLFSYGQLNLASLISEKRKAIYKTGLLKKEVIEIFKYEKNNYRY